MYYEITDLRKYRQSQGIKLTLQNRKCTWPMINLVTN